MRAVLDTNVLVSSLWGGIPRRFVDHWHAGRLIILVSEEILEEYIEVLSRFDIEDNEMDLFRALFADRARTEIFAPTQRLRVVPKDPGDDKFIECAIAAKADCVVSGDKHLKALGSFRGIPILNPRQAIEAL